MVKYIRKKYLKHIDLCDLDLQYPDEIFGQNDEGHDFNEILMNSTSLGNVTALS